MTTVPIRCPVVRCACVLRVEQWRYDDSDVIPLIDQQCASGHIFTFQKSKCPRCGNRMHAARWSEFQPWGADGVSRDLAPVFRHAECTNTECLYQGAEEG